MLARQSMSDEVALARVYVYVYVSMADGIDGWFMNHSAHSTTSPIYPNTTQHNNNTTTTTTRHVPYVPSSFFFFLLCLLLRRNTPYPCENLNDAHGMLCVVQHTHTHTHTNKTRLDVFFPRMYVCVANSNRVNDAPHPCRM